jgi:hypothetical protein
MLVVQGAQPQQRGRRLHLRLVRLHRQDLLH